MNYAQPVIVDATEASSGLNFAVGKKNDDAEVGLCGPALYLCGYYVFFSRWIGD